jgi:hypothetical protein
VSRSRDRVGGQPLGRHFEYLPTIHPAQRQQVVDHDSFNLTVQVGIDVFLSMTRIMVQLVSQSDGGRVGIANTWEGSGILDAPATQARAHPR